MFRCRSKFALGMAIFALIAGPVVATNRAARKVTFFPVTLLLSCGNSTPKENRAIYHGSPNAAPGVGRSECADTRAGLTGITPLGIRVHYVESLDKFEVIIDLKQADAKVLQNATAAISSKGGGQRMLVGAGGSIVASGFLFAPFTGRSFHISATSQEDAHRLAWLFVKPTGESPTASHSAHEPTEK